MTCPSCAGYEKVFGEKEARSELKKYREKGPDGTSQMLLDALLEAGVEGATHLDIGGGVGALHHELLKAGAASVIDVDGSAAYIDASSSEAERQGTSDRIDYRFANFVEEAPNLDQSDVVTLDRVICCFPYVDDLVTMSTAKAKRYYGVVYPRDWLAAKFLLKLGNGYFKLRRNPFRAFVHDPKHIDAMIRDAGFTPRYQDKTLIWNVALYEKATTS